MVELTLDILNRLNIPTDMVGFLVGESKNGVQSRPVTFGTMLTIVSMFFKQSNPDDGVMNWIQKGSRNKAGYSDEVFECRGGKCMFIFISSTNPETGKSLWVKPTPENTCYYKELCTGEFYYL